MKSQLISILLTIVILVSYYLIAKKKNPALFIINTKRVICPKCKTKLPYFRIPKSLKQAIWGGHTCPKCKTELDQFGNIIN